jgi:hypothetical protein
LRFQAARASKVFGLDIARIFDPVLDAERDRRGPLLWIWKMRLFLDLVRASTRYLYQ